MSPANSLAIVVAIAVAVTVMAVFVSLPREQNAPGIAQDDIDTNLQSGLANETTIESVVYTAKFECGTIVGDEGPLRPGHYDTDIGILNKQDFGVQFTWTAVVNDGRPANPVFRTLQPQMSTGIVCDDLRRLIGDERFVEGFVIIDVPLSGQLFSGSSAIVGRQSNTIDVLDVQVFYTANALEELPHEVFVDKITFTVQSDQSGKLPQEMIGTTLDVTVRSDLNEISNPLEKARKVLSEKYGLSLSEAQNLDINIEMVGVGVGTMIDDHAISLAKISPQIRN